MNSFFANNLFFLPFLYAVVTIIITSKENFHFLQTDKFQLQLNFSCIRVQKYQKIFFESRYNFRNLVIASNTFLYAEKKSGYRERENFGSQKRIFLFRGELRSMARILMRHIVIFFNRYIFFFKFQLKFIYK